jgi:protein-tyrosine phosphatase
MKILMVCLGNICRSPLAEGILKHKIEQKGLDWEVDSAGTESDHVGEPPHRLSQKIAFLHDIDISGQRARQFTRFDFDNFDRIYAMAPDVCREMRYIGGRDAPMSKVMLLLNELYPGKNLPVPDPWYGGEAEFRTAYQLIEAACDKIVEKYGRNSRQDKQNHTVEGDNR